MNSFDFLGSDQTLFSNPDALDPDFVPKLLPHRENEQRVLVNAIHPLLHNRTGISIIAHGPSGVGKTASTRRILMDLEELSEADNIAKVFINCWKANTTYKVMSEIAKQLGFKFTHNLKTNEIIDRVIDKLKSREGVVIILDEADKSDDYDFLYHILENIKKRTVILLTNDSEWSGKLDFRISSRLTPELVEFKSYTYSETFDILKERIKYAFYQNVWDDATIKMLAEKASEYKDIRFGITLLKLSGEIAEAESEKKITVTHVESAIKKLPDFKIKSSSDFNDAENFVLKICEEFSGKTTGELYKLYQKRGGKKSEKTFKRVLDILSKKRIITQRPTGEGFQGRSSIIEYRSPEKKLTDY